MDLIALTAEDSQGVCLQTHFAVIVLKLKKPLTQVLALFDTHEDASASHGTTVEGFPFALRLRMQPHVKVTSNQCNKNDSMGQPVFTTGSDLLASIIRQHQHSHYFVQSLTYVCGRSIVSNLKDTSLQL